MPFCLTTSPKRAAIPTKTYRLATIFDGVAGSVAKDFPGVKRRCHTIAPQKYGFCIAIKIAFLQYRCQRLNWVLRGIQLYGILAGMEKRRVHYNTTIDQDLLKKLKHLSVELGVRHNDLLEEAIADLVEKYEKNRQTHPR